MSTREPYACLYYIFSLEDLVQYFSVSRRVLDDLFLFGLGGRVGGESELQGYLEWWCGLNNSMKKKKKSMRNWGCNDPLLRTTITQLALLSKLINVLNTTNEVYDNVEKILEALSLTQ